MDNIYEKIDKIDGWFSKSQCEVVYPYVRQLKEKSLLVELGTYRGRTSLFFTLVNPEINIITIDMVNYGWRTLTDPMGMKIVSESIDPSVLKSGRIAQVIGTTNEVVKTFNLPIDLLFIDANHDYEFVRDDISNWKNLVVVNGKIIFHDYDDAHEGVRRAIEEWLEVDSRFKLIESGNSIAVVERVS